MTSSKRDRKVIFEILWNLSSNESGVKQWIRKKPQCFIDIIKTAQQSIRDVLMMDCIRQQTYEYSLALSSVGILANVLSTDVGLKMMMRLLPTYDFYDFLIWSVLYMTSPKANDLKKYALRRKSNDFREILRCLRFMFRFSPAANYFRSNNTLYKILQFSLTPNNPDDIIENSLFIIKNLLDNIVEPKLLLNVIKNLPIVEIKQISNNRKGNLKHLSQCVFRKGLIINQLYNEPKPEQTTETAKSIREIRINIAHFTSCKTAPEAKGDARKNSFQARVHPNRLHAHQMGDHIVPRTKYRPTAPIIKKHKSIEVIFTKNKSNTKGKAQINRPNQNTKRKGNQNALAALDRPITAPTKTLKKASKTKAKPVKKSVSFAFADAKR